MTSSVTDFAIRGHQKIIEHYRRVLANQDALSPNERELIIVRLVEEERQLNLLLKNTKRGRA